MNQRSDLTKIQSNDPNFSCQTLTSRIGTYHLSHRHQTLNASAQLLAHQSLDPMCVPKALGLVHECLLHG